MKIKNLHKLIFVFFLFVLNGCDFFGTSTTTTTQTTTTAPVTTTQQTTTTQITTTTTQSTTTELVTTDSELTIKLKQIYNLAVEADAFDGTYEEWLETVQGPQGDPGEQVLLRVSTGYIQWKYESDTTWQNLISLLDLTGETGVGIESTSISDIGELIIIYTDDTQVNLGTIIPIFHVNFRDYNGYLIDTQNVMYGDQAVPPINPTRLGYTFIGWDISFDIVTSDLIVTAEYEANKYTIIFDSNGGSDVTNMTDVPYGITLELPTPTRTGFDFIGWFVGGDANAAQFTTDDPVPGDLVLIARWILQEYDVEFLDYDNTLISVQKVSYGFSAIAPQAPTRTGYTFVGWSEDFMLILSNTAIYAVYELNTYNILFESEGDLEINPISNIDYDTTVTLPVPVRDGYKFLGWYNNGSLFTDSDPVLSNMTLVAHWVESDVPYEFNIREDGIYITRYIGSESNIVIPDFIGNIAVVGIDNEAFKNNETLRQISIGPNITFIGDAAFGYMTNLRFFEIPLNSNLTHIGVEAFSGSDLLQYLFIPTSVEYIGVGAFYSCYSLSLFIQSATEPVTWNDGWDDTAHPAMSKYINIAYFGEFNGMIYAVSNEGYVIIVTESLGNYGNVDNLDLVIPNLISGIPVTTIAGKAFDGHDWLNSIRIPTSVTILDYQCIANNGLFQIYTAYESYPDFWGEELYWNPDGYPINYAVEEGLSYETAIEVNLDEETPVLNIGDNVFFKFTPNETMTYYIYSVGDTDPAAIIYDSEQNSLSYNHDWGQDWNFLITIELTEGETYYLQTYWERDVEHQEYTVIFGTEDPNNFTFEYELIGESYMITGIDGVGVYLTIPETINGLPVTKIAPHSFEGDMDIATLVIPSTVLEIGEAAFKGSLGFQTVVIPNTVSIIGYEAFSTCPNLIIYVDALAPTFGFVDGWYDDATVIWNYNALTEVTYHFETNGGTAISDNTTEFAIFEPSTSKDGYSLEGWYEEADFSGNPIVFPYYSTTDITLYANWISENSIAEFLDYAIEIGIDDPFEVTIYQDGDYAYFKYVVPSDATQQYFFYSFSVYNLVDTYALLYDSVGDMITWDDDAGPSSNFFLVYELEAGQTYYFAVTSLSGLDSSWFYVNLASFDPLIDYAFELLDNDTYAITDYVGDESAITLPASYKGKPVTEIADYAFSDQWYIESIIIPEGYILIGTEAFSSMYSLEILVIPASMVQVGYSAIHTCDDLVIYITQGIEMMLWNPSWNIDNYPVIFNYNGTETTYVFNVNGGTSIDEINTVYAVDEQFTSRLNYTFIGWYFSADFSGDPVAFPYCSDDPVVTFYAKWEWVETYPGSFFSSAFTLLLDTNTDVIVSNPDEMVYFEFTPTVTASYSITSLGDFDTIGSLYDSAYNIITSDDDGGSGSNFRLTYELIAGETYYIQTGFWSGTETGTFSIIIFQLIETTYSFEENGGNVLEDITTDGYLYEPEISKEGYGFTGWYLTADFSDEMIQFPYMSFESTVVLYAKWIEDSAGGSSYDTAIPIVVDDEMYVIIDVYDETVYFVFIPLVTGTYTIYTNGECDTVGGIYNDADLYYSPIAENDDAGVGSNFLLSVDLDAGSTYYIQAHLFWPDSEGTFSINIELNN